MKLIYLLLLTTLCLSLGMRLERKKHIMGFFDLKDVNVFSQGMSEIGVNTWKYLVNMKDEQVTMHTLALNNLKHLKLDVEEQAKELCKLGFTTVIANAASLFELNVLSLRIEATLEREARKCPLESAIHPKQISYSPMKPKFSPRTSAKVIQKLAADDDPDMPEEDSNSPELKDIEAIETIIYKKIDKTPKYSDEMRYRTRNENDLLEEIDNIRQKPFEKALDKCSTFSKMLATMQKLQKEGEELLKSSKNKDTSVCENIDLSRIKAETQEITDSLENYKKVLKRTEELGLELIKSDQTIKLIENAKKIALSASKKQLEAANLVKDQIQKTFSISNKVLAKTALLVALAVTNYGSIIYEGVMKAIYFYKDYKNKGMTKKEALKRLMKILVTLLLKTGIQAVKVFLQAIPPLQFVVSGVVFVVNWHINRKKMLDLVTKHHSGFAENTVAAFTELTELNHEMRYLDFDSFSFINETVKIYENAPYLGVLSESEITNNERAIEICNKNPFNCLKRGFNKEIKTHLLQSRICPTDIQKVSDGKQIEILESIGYISIFRSEDNSQVFIGFKEEGHSIVEFRVPNKIFNFEIERFRSDSSDYEYKSFKTENRSKFMEYSISRTSKPEPNCKELSQILKYELSEKYLTKYVNFTARNQVANYLKTDYLQPKCEDALVFRPKTAYLSVTNLLRQLAIHREMNLHTYWQLARDNLICLLENRNQTIRVSSHSRLFVRDVYTLVSRSDDYLEKVEERNLGKDFKDLYLKTFGPKYIFNYTPPFPVMNAVGSRSCLNFGFREEYFRDIANNANSKGNCKEEINCVMTNLRLSGLKLHRDTVYSHDELLRTRPKLKNNEYVLPISDNSGCKYSFTNKNIFLDRGYSKLEDIHFDLSKENPLQVNENKTEKPIGRKIVVIYHEVEAKLLLNEKERVEYDQLTRGRMEMYTNLGYIPIEEKSTKRFVVPLKIKDRLKTAVRVVHMLVLAGPWRGEGDKLSEKCREIIEE